MNDCQSQLRCKVSAVVFIVIFAVLSIVFSSLSKHFANQALEDKIIDVKDKVFSLQETLLFLISENETAQLQKTITFLGTHIDLNRALLINAKKNVIASSRIEYINKPIAKVFTPTTLVIVLNELKKVTLNKKIHVWVTDDKKTLYAVVPVITPQHSSKLLRQETVATLFIEYQLNNDNPMSLLRFQSLFYPIAIALFLAAVCITVYLNFVVSRRIQIIQRALESFSDEKVFNPINVKGNDELSKVGHAFNEMANKVLHQNQYLHQFKYMIASSPDMQALVDKNFVYLAANNAYAVRFNLTVEQVIGQKVIDVVGEEYFNSISKVNIERCLKGETVRTEQWLSFPSSDKKYMESTFLPYLKSDDDIHGIVICVRDITVQKRQQVDIEKSNLVVENSPVVIFRWRADSPRTVEYVSKNVIIFGYRANDFLTGEIQYKDILHPDDVTKFNDDIAYFTQRGFSQFKHEYRITSPTKEICWIESRTSIERDLQGKAIFYQGVIIDITERKQAELKLDESNTLLTNVINSTPDLIFAKNSQLQYILVNNAFAKSKNQSVQSLMGTKDHQNNLNVEQRSRIESQDKKVLAGETIHSKNCTSLAMNKNIIEITKAPLLKEDGEIAGLIGIGHDITVHIKSLKKISKQQKELSQIIDAMFDAVITIDDTGTIQTFNKAAEGIFGFRVEEILGKNINLLILEECIDQLYDHIKNRPLTYEEKTINYEREVTAQTKDNLLFPINLSIAELPKNALDKRHFIVVCQDLTKIKHHEELFNRSQKMDALGQLTGGIAHDYNNILGVILGYGELLKMQLTETPKLLNYVDQISQAGTRAAQLTRKLLSFSCQTPAQKSDININVLINNNVEMLTKTLITVELQLKLNKDISFVNIDSNSFEDMLLNISINAMHAMPNGGQLIISTNKVTLSKEQASTLDVKAGEFVLLSIEDNGKGMTEDIKDKIFEPFFSTKGKQGTGLGLAQVYSFIRSSAGAITVYSELDKGTQFLLYFPIHSSITEKKPVVKIEHKQVLSGSETILVVDDEPQLCNLATEILLAHGYQTLTAANGLEGLALLQLHHVDLIVSDLIMPKMNGYELMAQVQTRYPDTKMILASGFQGENAKTTLCAPVLEKPYNSVRLLTLIRQSLDTKRPYHQQILSPSIIRRIKWTSEMSIDGGGLLDDDHKNLCKLLNRCQDLLGKNDIHQRLDQIISELVEYTNVHFKREELAMKACHYPYYKNHCEVHNMMADTLTSVIKNNSDQYILKWLTTNLTDWLMEHVMVMDKSLDIFIEKYKEQVQQALANKVNGDCDE
ncbi:MAG: PAS domain-containing protein [Gammaproteobacteria bacterium]|nr:PAS domain-containing protein [Gammaproteobacteria bacterium]